MSQVLAGLIPYDNVGPTEQAVVRGAWEHLIEDAVGRLDYEDDLRADGQPWAEADDRGDLVVRGSHEQL